MQNQFTHMALSNDIIETLTALKYTTPTEIQSIIIPLILDGRDVVAKSKTGSGKTAAFGIPLCEMTTWEGRLPQVLILEPTRELAEQVRMELFCISRNKRLKIPAIFGGFPIDKQIQTLRQKTHIVVGTPGRLLDHVRRGSINLSEVTKVVIDEADLMLDMGFIDEVGTLLEQTPIRNQTILCSATIDEQLDILIQTYMNTPKLVQLNQEEITASEITQVFYPSDRENKFNHLQQVLISHNPISCVIFCGTKEMVQVLFQKLKRDKIYTVMLHGDQDQRERMKAVDDFARGKSRFLIATDLASRGIDFTKVSHVINYDFPTGKETYVHRIGRTGRNKEQGTAISLLTAEDYRMKLSVQAYIHMDIQETTLPSITTKERDTFYNTQRKVVSLKPTKDAPFQKDITKLLIGGGRKSKMRAFDIVGSICSIQTLTNDDIGIIDVRDSVTYVEILNKKGQLVYQNLQTKTIKGKVRKIKRLP
ncbi:MAG: DEAD/DEAH box helicase [Eubacteriales bacterium]